MLKGLLLLCLLVPTCWGEVPYTTGNIATDENFKQVDSRIKKINTTINLAISTTASLNGDVVGPFFNTQVVDNSHGHTFSTITGPAPTATYAVTAGSASYLVLPTSALLDIALEHVTLSGTGFENTVSCSAGKYILGGGCDTTDSAVGTIRENYPPTSTTWKCKQTGTINTMTVYAICGRIKL